MTSGELREIVRSHYGSQGRSHALFEEVRSETGFTAGVATRSCDMLALSLWRSKLIELHGLEIKVSRGDWLRELRQPDKAGAFAKYVDRWWLVAPTDMVHQSELPAGWGLMEPDDERIVAKLSPPHLRVVVKAPKRDGAPLDRLFVASLVRKVARGEFSLGAKAHA